MTNTDVCSQEQITISEHRLDVSVSSGFLTSRSTVRDRKRSSKNLLSPISLSYSQTALSLVRAALSANSSCENSLFFWFLLPCFVSRARMHLSPGVLARLDAIRFAGTGKKKHSARQSIVFERKKKKKRQTELKGSGKKKSR